jgi:hypothetical protein
LIAEKPWDMRGEVKSLERPENSLLEITAQVERYVVRAVTISALLFSHILLPICACVCLRVFLNFLIA